VKCHTIKNAGLTIGNFNGSEGMKGNRRAGNRRPEEHKGDTN